MFFLYIVKLNQTFIFELHLEIKIKISFKKNTIFNSANI